MPAIETLSASKLEALYAKRDAVCSEINRAFIDAGRGMEKLGDILKMSDSLAVRYQEAHKAFMEVVGEKEARKRWHGSLKPIKKSVWI